MFRGHKGREVAEIERGLRDLEEKAKPLFARFFATFTSIDRSFSMYNCNILVESSNWKRKVLS